MRKFLLFASIALGLVAIVLPINAMGNGIITENGAPLNDAIVFFEGKFSKTRWAQEWNARPHLK